MERKKIFRSVWFWVVLVVLLALTFSSFFRGSGEYSEVSTSTALSQFADVELEPGTEPFTPKPAALLPRSLADRG